MRVPSVAIFTLAALAACGFSPMALAQPNSSSGTQKAGNSNVVVSVEPTATPVTAIIANPKAGSSNFVVPVETAPKPTSTAVVPTPAGVTRGTSITSGGQNDVAVTATDVQIVGANQELQQIIRETIATRLGGTTSTNQVQKDVAALLATGLFADVRVNTQNTPGGLKVVYQVQPVVLRSLQLSGNQVLTPTVANDLFKSQIGTQISPTAIRAAVQQLNQWYTKNGYVLAQVAAVRPNREGILMVEVAEGVIGDINIRFLDKDGKPTPGRTKQDFITRQLKLKPGQVFRVDVVQGDLKQLSQTGLFDKADISLTGDAKKVSVNYDITERPARSVNAGGGYNSDSGIVGTVNYTDQNLGGVNQQVGVNVQAGSRDLQFDGRFTNPYNASNPNNFGYTINAFRRRGLSSTFDEDIKLGNGDQVREGKFGGGITFTRPLDDWQASLGLNYTRISTSDRAGNLAAVDAQNNPLTFSQTGVDDLVTVSAGFAKDERNNPVNPTHGSLLSFTTEQSIPIGSGNILMNRVQANYSQYIPTGLLGGSQPEVLAFNIQGGTTIGDLPPYQAFNLGGLNSVRGYNNNAVASGRSFVLATAEYRFPIFSPVGGVFFADYASDLGSSDSVLGQPGVERGKPGSGFGYGAGVRLNSPIGLIRADYGFNDQGESRLQFGIGQRF